MNSDIIAECLRELLEIADQMKDQDDNYNPSMAEHLELYVESVRKATKVVELMVADKLFGRAFDDYFRWGSPLNMRIGNVRDRIRKEARAMDMGVNQA